MLLYTGLMFSRSTADQSFHTDLVLIPLSKVKSLRIVTSDESSAVQALYFDMGSTVIEVPWTGLMTFITSSGDWVKVDLSSADAMGLIEDIVKITNLI